MLKNTTYFSLLFLLLVSTGINAQNHKCGVTAHMGSMIQEQMIENRNEMRNFVEERVATVYLPVRFHLVAKSDGSDRTKETDALTAICNLNNNFEDQEIQFYIHEFKYLNSTTLYNNAMSNGSYSVLNNNIIYNAINIFLVDDAGGGAAAFYKPPAGQFGDDWVVCSQSYADDFETLTHEIGHFFSLNHPFYGWEPTDNGWDPAEHGNPVGIWAPDNNTRNEFADGSNCANAGDMICDTPADYLFPFPGNNGCTYDKNAKDPNNQLLTPDMTNFMNYASCSNSLYHFTDMQKDEVQNSLNSSSRNYIPKNNTPNLDEVTDSPTQLSPQNLQTVDTYNNVTLEWTAVDNAENYLVEVISTSSGSQIINTDQTSITLTNLEASSNYFWKVYGYNEYSTCAGGSGQRIFKTGSTLTDTNEITALQEWGINPNPVSNGESIFVNIESATGVTLDVSVSTITGQIIETYEDQIFANGTSVFEIETFNMPAGMYLVSLHTDEGVETQRVSVL